MSLGFLGKCGGMQVQGTELHMLSKKSEKGQCTRRILRDFGKSNPRLTQQIVQVTNQYLYRITVVITIHSPLNSPIEGGCLKVCILTRLMNQLGRFTSRMEIIIHITITRSLLRQAIWLQKNIAWQSPVTQIFPCTTVLRLVRVILFLWQRHLKWMKMSLLLCHTAIIKARSLQTTWVLDITLPVTLKCTCIWKSVPICRGI